MFIKHLLWAPGAGKKNHTTKDEVADCTIATQVSVPEHVDDTYIHEGESLALSVEGEPSTRPMTLSKCDEVKVDGRKAKAIALSDKVSLLKDQLAVQDASTLEQYQEAMERKEKVHNKRVLMLEMEVARLIEMQNKSCRQEQENSNIQYSRREIGSTQDFSLCAPVAMKEGKYCDALRNTNLEISALEELLSRVLAERDLLSFRNKNLESLVKEFSNEKDTERRAGRYYRHNQAKGGVIYQLSCRKCNEKIIGTTCEDLRSTVLDQFSEIWPLVQRRCHKSWCNDETLGKFSQTQFAMHIANHCKDAKSQENVMVWCKKNVKVDVLKIELD